jgi:hypothetical protein
MNTEESSPKLLNSPSGENDAKDKLAVFKKPSLIPSLSPSRNRKSMSASSKLFELILFEIDLGRDSALYQLKQ